MSKKIVIPHCQNPFVVIVNGVRYEYESGKETEVPDEVAEVIQFHVDSKPRPKPADGGSEEDSSGGGAKLYRHDINLIDRYWNGCDIFITIYNTDATNYSMPNEYDDDEKDISSILALLPKGISSATGSCDVNANGYCYPVYAISSDGDAYYNWTSTDDGGYVSTGFDRQAIVITEVKDTVTQIM